MAIEKRVVVNRIGTTREGTLELQLCLEVVEDGKILSSTYHRTRLEPGVNLNDQVAFVNTHLASMTPPWPPIMPLGDLGVERIRPIVAAEHTPERITKFKQK